MSSPTYLYNIIIIIHFDGSRLLRRSQVVNKSKGLVSAIISIILSLDIIIYSRCTWVPVTYRLLHGSDFGRVVNTISAFAVRNAHVKKYGHHLPTFDATIFLTFFLS